MKFFKTGSGSQKAGSVILTLFVFLSGLPLGVMPALAVVDATPPTDPTVFDSPSHTKGVWSTETTIGINWIGGTDTESGVAGYSFSWTKDTTDLPDRIIDAAATDFNRPTIAAGGEHTVGLRSDGTVIAEGGQNYYGETGGTASWTDIIAVAAGAGHTVGLESSGTVVAAGNNSYGQTTGTASWIDIVAIAAGERHTIGLKSDGTVVATGADSYGQVTEVASWTDIVAVAASMSHTVGLKADGTVVAAGFDYDGQVTGVSSWTDIVAVAAGWDHTVGLKSDGTVVAVGRDYDGDVTGVSSWTDIVAIAAGELQTIGLKSDGTALALGYAGYRTTNVSSWTGVVAIAASEYQTIGLKSDGTMMGAVYSGANVSTWADVRQPTYIAADYGVSGDGAWWFNLRTADQAGNWTGTVHEGPFNIDTTGPIGSIKINNGAAYTKSTAVTLELSASDAGELDKMRIKNEGGSWSSWQNYAVAKSWALSSGDGAKKVYYQVKDKVGHISSAYSDAIVLDTQKPTTRMVTPFVSTKISKTTTFKVKWSATDGSASSGIKGYTVRYRPSTSKTWRTWKADTTDTQAYFKGKAGVTYYFKTVAVDNAGNQGWSKVDKTIVPFNEGIFEKMIGFSGYKKLGKSRNYLASVRYSYTRGDTLIYKLANTDGIGLIVTTGPKMGKAKIYIDGKHVKTVDAYSSKTGARQLIRYRNFAKKGTHRLKIVNLGTPGRARFQVDGIVVKR